MAFSNNLGNVAGNDSNVIFTNTSNRTQICNPTAPRTYTLPSTSIIAGDSWTFYNQATSSANYITIQSSGSNLVCILPPLGQVTLISAISSPITAGNWIVANRQSQLVPFIPVLTGFGTTANVSAFSSLNGDILYINGSFNPGTPTTAFGTFSLSPGFAINPAKLSLNNTTSSEGNLVGQFGQSIADQFCCIITAPVTSTSVVYLGVNFTATQIITPAQAMQSVSPTLNVSYEFRDPVF